jgi:hypothetical protein
MIYLCTFLSEESSVALKAESADSSHPVSIQTTARGAPMVCPKHTPPVMTRCWSRRYKI